jgi:hypothetical protein
MVSRFQQGKEMGVDYGKYFSITEMAVARIIESALIKP